VSALSYSKSAAHPTAGTRGLRHDALQQVLARASPFGETAVTSDSDRSEAPSPDAAASPPLASDARAPAAADAAIGYEAADPSLFLSQWSEALPHRESTPRER
jgi:hypothetical protein